MKSPALKNDKGPISITKSSSQSSPSVQEILQNLNISLDGDYTTAKYCLTAIEDPLWRHICQDVMTMMGPTSLLKIWDSTLGEVSSQSKSVDIYSPTEIATQFINQYSFVILGSLKTYFPALKQINVKTILP